MSVYHLVDLKVVGEMGILERKPAPVPLCSLKIPPCPDLESKPYLVYRTYGINYDTASVIQITKRSD
jgi:hypothetical protein